MQQADLKIHLEILELTVVPLGKNQPSPLRKKVLLFRTVSQQNSEKKKVTTSSGEKLLVILLINSEILAPRGFSKKSWDSKWDTAGFLNRAAHLSVSDSHPRPGLSFGGIQPVGFFVE